MPCRDRKVLMFQKFKPRCMIGGGCRKWCVSAQFALGKFKCADCSMSGSRFNQVEARLQQWGNREINQHYVHEHVSMEVLVTIMTSSPEQERIQKYYSLSLRISIKPQQLRHLMMSGICLDVKRRFAWMMQSWTSVVLNVSHGTASKTFAWHDECPTFHDVQVCVAGSPARHSPWHHLQQPTSLASESVWKALVLFSWLLMGWPEVNASESKRAHFLDARLELFFGLRIGLLSGPWFVPNLIVLRWRIRRAERTSSRCSHVFAKSAQKRVLVKKDELGSCQKCTTSPSHGADCSLWRVTILVTQNPQLLRSRLCQAYSCLKWPRMSLPHSKRCFGSLKSVMTVKKDSVAKCSGLQYIVGRPDGANTMIKNIHYLEEADNSLVLVALYL